MATFQPFTNFYLIKDVDIDNSYNHQYYFETKQAQYNFFKSKRYLEVIPGTYQRKNAMTIQVPFLADNLREVKYIMWKNLLSETGESESAEYEGWYYAFVTSVDYVTPDVSTITYQLDVYQTYLFDMEWHESFIDREHKNRGTLLNPEIYVEDEGLDYGSSYKILGRETLQQFNDELTNDTRFLLVGLKLPDSSASVVGQIDTQLAYYVVPFNINSYNAVYKFGDDILTSAYDFLDFLRTSTTYVNTCVSALILSYYPANDISISRAGLTYTISSNYYLYKTSLGGKNVLACEGTHIVEMTSSYQKYNLIANEYTSQGITETKLCMFPYAFCELTTERGNVLPIKLEYISDENLIIGYQGTINHTNTSAYLVKNYLSSGFRHENGIIDNSSSSMPIIDDYTASYLQSNSNANEVALSNAKATLTAQLQNTYASYGTAQSVANHNRDTSLSNRTTNLTAGIITTTANAIVAGGSAKGGLLTKSAVAGASAVGGATSTMTEYVTSGRTIENTYDNAMLSAVTNRINSVRSETTSYQNTVNSVMAKVHDAQMIPPSVTSMGGDFFFNICNAYDKVYLQWKVIEPHYAKKLNNYFKQYGYKVNNLEEPAFHTRANWNYIKMTVPNVYGNIPMDDLMAIRGIFTNGITLWHGDYIGNYDMDNAEI